MKDIVIIDRDEDARWEFLHTHGLHGWTELRLRGFRNRTDQWRLTAEEQHRRVKDEPSVISLHVPEDEEPNTCERPEVPEQVVLAACNKAGPKAMFKDWPSLPDERAPAPRPPTRRIPIGAGDSL